MTHSAPNSPPSSPDAPSSVVSFDRPGETLTEALAPTAANSRPDLVESSLRRRARLMVESMRHPPQPPAPQLMAALREAWDSLPEVSALAPGAQRRALLDRLLSLSIEEYYRPTER